MNQIILLQKERSSSKTSRLRRSHTSVTQNSTPSFRLRRSRTLPLLTLLLFPLLLIAQTPGGVSGTKLWYTSEVTPTGQIAWKDQLGNPVSHAQANQIKASKNTWLNFNPAFQFESTTKGIVLPLSHLSLEKWTLFTVYQAQDSLTEKSIWSYTESGKTRGLLTTHRMADLQRFEYLNFPQVARGFPIINTYLHHESKKNDASTKEKSLILAHPPKDHQLPITAFSGQLAELILYERVLAPQERQRVESYLAIKYGTNLAPSEAINYLDAGGQIVYSPADAADHIHRLTGIGRDDRSGLYQKQSTSSYTPGLLTLSAGTQAADNSTNPHVIPDQHYLLWADNDARLEWNEKQTLQAPSLQRSWQVKTTGAWSPITTELQFDTKQLPVPAARGEIYWLLIDRSGKDQFNDGRSVDYFPQTSLSASGKAIFQNIRWDTDGSGSDAFTIAGGPELMVRAHLQAPGCFPEYSGSIALQAIGGRPPYHFQLSKDQHLVKEWTDKAAALQEITGLTAGDYELLVSDADHHTYRETFFFQSEDAPLIPLAQHYQLPPEGRLLLDANQASTEELSYQWLSPNGQITKGPSLEITQAGIYQIEVDRVGCLARRQIIVEPAIQGNFRRVELFPNPSTNGNFQIRVHLNHRADLHISLFDPSGRQVLQQRQSGSNYYHHVGQKLSTSGTYLIQLQSQNDQITFPLIVQ